MKDLLGGWNVEYFTSQIGLQFVHFEEKRTIYTNKFAEKLNISYLWLTCLLSKLGKFPENSCNSFSVPQAFLWHPCMYCAEACVTQHHYEHINYTLTQNLLIKRHFTESQNSTLYTKLIY